MNIAEAANKKVCQSELVEDSRAGARYYGQQAHYAGQKPKPGAIPPLRKGRKGFMEKDDHRTHKPLPAITLVQRAPPVGRELKMIIFNFLIL